MAKPTAAQIKKDIAKLQAKLSPMEDAARTATLKALVGKCFVYRHNCYSMPKTEADYWDVYYRVTGHDDYWPRGLEIQRTATSEIIIRPNSQNSSVGRSLGWQPCACEEFNRALARIIENVAKLNDPKPL